jgi:hypothetical protein
MHCDCVPVRVSAVQMHIITRSTKSHFRVRVATSYGEISCSTVTNGVNDAREDRTVELVLRFSRSFDSWITASPRNELAPHLVATRSCQILIKIT